MSLFSLHVACLSTLPAGNCPNQTSRRVINKPLIVVGGGMIDSDMGTEVNILQLDVQVKEHRGLFREWLIMASSYILCLFGLELVIDFLYLPILFPAYLCSFLFVSADFWLFIHLISFG